MTTKYSTNCAQGQRRQPRYPTTRPGFHLADEQRTVRACRRPRREYTISHSELHAGRDKVLGGRGAKLALCDDFWRPVCWGPYWKLSCLPHPTASGSCPRGTAPALNESAERNETLAKRPKAPYTTFPSSGQHDRGPSRYILRAIR